MRATLKKFFAAGRLAAVYFGLALLLFPLCAAAGAQEQDEPQAQQATPQRPARAANLMQRLNLTREQRQRLREIRRQSEAETRDLTRRLRLARRALDDAIYADAADEALVEQRSRELAVLQNLVAHQRALTELRVRRVLSDEQLRLFRDLRRQAQRRQMLQRRMNRALRRSAPPPPDEPGADAPSVTEPRAAPNAPPARRRRP